jgi:thiamine-phosphate pyrophosphorylase
MGVGMEMVSHETLPELLLITPEPWADADAGFGASSFDDFLARLDRALESGISLVQLRAKRLDPERFDALARRALNACHARGARLVLNGPAGVQRAVGEAHADGWHLTSEQLMHRSERKLPDAQLLSAACHSEQQLAHAERIGVDFVTVSPVLPTTSHPGAPALGWNRFAELVSRTQLPVYALGGMTRAHCAEARARGAQGIAAISGLW